MQLKEMIGLIRYATTEGARRALENSVALPVLISKAEAYRTYGRTQVDRWITEGLLKCSTSANSSKMMIDRTKLEAIAAASNRVTYLPVADR